MPLNSELLEAKLYVYMYTVSKWKRPPSFRAIIVNHISLWLKSCMWLPAKKQLKRVSRWI